MLEKLIQGCLDGDRRSQKDLYYLYLSELKSISLRYTPRDAEAKDVLQNAFIRIFNNLSKVDNTRDTLFPWMRKIVINEALRVKRSHFTIPLSEEEHLPFLESKLDDALNELVTNDLIKIIDQLPEKYRLVFQLKEIEGFSHTEIGEMLGMETSSSRSLLTRAKSKLKALVENNHQSNRSIKLIRS